SSNQQAYPLTFYADELRRALAEQAFGIKHKVAFSSSATEATATIVLLEETSIDVLLDTEGYK
ncbi:hypothetical protein K488DRAFT_23498, partial [Vararia minispora EC-137]